MPVPMKKSQDRSSGRFDRRADEPPGLVAEIEQDGTRIEQTCLAAVRPVGVDDRGKLAVRVDGAEGRPVLLALFGVDRYHLVGQPGFLQEQRDLGGVGRWVEVETDHGVFLAREQCLRPSAHAWPPERCILDQTI